MKVEKELIGNINCIYKMQFIKKTIQKGVFEKISIGVSPFGICSLSNGCFISNNSSSITLFNENFKQLIETGIPGHAMGCAVYNDKDIYITDNTKSCIYLMDIELNIKKIFGSKGSGVDQFNYPFTIFCKNEYLFVSDHANKRIQILTLNLEYHDSIQLDFDPVSIAVSSTTIGIHGNDNTCFYDIKTKILKKKYSDIFGRISLIDSYFYVISCKPPKKLFIFDQEGELVDEACLESISEHITNLYWDGFMFLTNDYLFISSYTGKKVLKFKF